MRILARAPTLPHRNRIFLLCIRYRAFLSLYLASLSSSVNSVTWYDSGGVAYMHSTEEGHH